MQLVPPHSEIQMPPADDADQARIAFKLFVTGGTPRAERAVFDLRRLCDVELRGRGDFVVIDVLERPRMAEELRILVTPTLIKLAPGPIRRVVGDLSDTSKVLVGLNLWPDSEA